MDQGGGDGSLVHPAGGNRRNSRFNGTPAQEARLAAAEVTARQSVRKLRELDPEWRPPRSLTSTIEGEIRHQEGIASSANARYRELTRGAIPGFNPAWGVNRLRKELSESGYYFTNLTRPSSTGWLYVNPTTREEVRIMERPLHRWRTDPDAKFLNDYYYRYRSRPNEKERPHVPIPGKD